MKTNKGFSLVELIVVIAIMAIIAAVAIPVYNVYIDKANKQSDISLVSDVAKALELYYAGNPSGFTGGYVVIGKDGVEGDEIGLAALKASYGEDLSDIVLKYGEWSDNGMLTLVNGYTDEQIDRIVNSTFLTDASTDGLMNAVTNLTGSATTAITNWANAGAGNDVSEKLEQFLGEDGTEMVGKLEASGLAPEDDEYETAVSNLLVGYFAKTLSSTTLEDAMNDNLSSLTLVYATLYAFSETYEDKTVAANEMEKVNNALASTSNMGDYTPDIILETIANGDPDFASGFEAYYDASGPDDMQATLDLMSAVNLVSGSYTDKESLSDPNLYSSDATESQLKNFINAVNAKASGITVTADEGSIVVIITEKGEVSVYPSEAYFVA